MLVDFKNLTEWQRYYLIHVITDLDKENKDKYFSQYKNNNGIIDFSFKIDGFETDPLSVINRFEEVFDEEVSKKAKELIDEKVFNIQEKLQNSLYEELGIRDKEDY